MNRDSSQPRPNLDVALRDDGVVSAWDETVHWRFTADEIETLYGAAGEIHAMAVEAVGHVVEGRLYPLFGLTPEAGEAVGASWRSRDREMDLVTRLTLAWNGSDAPRLVSFQADSPSGLVEAAIAQWRWKESRFPGSDQFNSIDDDLGERMKALRALVPGVSNAVVTHLEGDASGEGQMAYIAKLAAYAGLEIERLPLQQIGWSDETREFYDMQEREIRLMFKSHPWQWLIADRFGENLMRSCSRERIEVVEPAWKLLLTNRAINAVLWEKYPFHPNLLETVTDPTMMVVSTDCLAIPKFADVGHAVREGRIESGRFVCPTAAPEGEEGEILQERPPHALGIEVLFDLWMIGGEAKGLGVREMRDEGETFVPHRFD